MSRQLLKIHFQASIWALRSTVGGKQTTTISIVTGLAARNSFLVDSLVFPKIIPIRTTIILLGWEVQFSESIAFQVVILKISIYWHQNEPDLSARVKRPWVTFAHVCCFVIGIGDDGEVKDWERTQMRYGEHLANYMRYCSVQLTLSCNVHVFIHRWTRCQSRVNLKIQETSARIIAREAACI